MAFSSSVIAARSERTRASIGCPGASHGRGGAAAAEADAEATSAATARWRTTIVCHDGRDIATHERTVTRVARRQASVARDRSLCERSHIACREYRSYN